MIVIRFVSRMCAAVSLPLPVRLSQATLVGLIILNESRPFGDKLTLPVEAAVATPALVRGLAIKKRGKIGSLGRKVFYHAECSLPREP